MKASELTTLSDAALSEKLTELYKEAFNMRFQRAANQLQNTSRIRQVRKDIARIKTVAAARSVEEAKEEEV